MSETESWTTLQRRAVGLIQYASTEESCDILTSVAAVIESVNDDQTKNRLVAMLTAACETAREKWDAERTPLTGPQLLAYGHATTQLAALPKMPDLRASWDDADRRLDSQLHSQPGYLLDANIMEEWIDLVTAVDKMEPRFMSMLRFPADYDNEIEALLDRIDEECAVGDYDDPGEMRDEADRLSSLAKVVHGLSECRGEHVEQAIELHKRVVDAASKLRDAADELEVPEPDYDDERPRAAGFDIAALFSDL